MNVEEMLVEAVKFQEYVSLRKDKPKIIRETIATIERNKQEIERLKKAPVEAGFFQKIFSKTSSSEKFIEAISGNKKYRTKIQELEAVNVELEKYVEDLENVFPVLLADIPQIKVEVENILAKQQAEADDLIPNIVAAQQNLVTLMNDYHKLIESGHNFTTTVVASINQGYKEVAKYEDKFVTPEASVPLPSITPKQLTLNNSVSTSPEVFTYKQELIKAVRGIAGAW